jgi:hypothetical protein
MIINSTKEVMAVIIAHAMNHGHLNMAETSDIPYHVLEATYQIIPAAFYVRSH